MVVEEEERMQNEPRGLNVKYSLSNRKWLDIPVLHLCVDPGQVVERTCHDSDSASTVELQLTGGEGLWKQVGTCQEH